MGGLLEVVHAILRVGPPIFFLGVGLRLFFDHEDFNLADIYERFFPRGRRMKAFSLLAGVVLCLLGLAWTGVFVVPIVIRDFI